MDLNLLDSLEACWEVNLQSIFAHKESAISGSGISKELKQLCLELKDIHINYIKVWWNVSSLENYDRQGIYPRGLRVQIFPSWYLNEDGRKLWETGLSKCSHIIVEMLLLHDRELLIQYKQKISDLKTQIGQMGPTDRIEAFMTDLKNELDKIETDIISNKTKKLSRDRLDYSLKRAYLWHHSGNPKGRKAWINNKKPRNIIKKNPTTGQGQAQTNTMSSCVSDSSDAFESDGTSHSAVQRMLATNTFGQAKKSFVKRRRMDKGSPEQTALQTLDS
ncbi:uncharacterized protein [Hyperolius riggenbachi]|uniref:uncharacterized protein n=1 Tax=Hyperolius riggenbachi TaxID=752182 RepID=UPI0035A2780D